MKLQLNFDKPDNYAFFCPVSRLHLTRTSPVGFADEVTPSIKRALKVGNILDITEEKAETEKPVTPQPAPEEQQTPNKEDDIVQEVKEEVTEPEVKEPEEASVKEVSEPIVEEAPKEVKETKKNRGRKRNS